MKILLAIAMLVLTCTAWAQGTSEAILGYTNNISVSVDGLTAGWTFQARTPVTVTELGCFVDMFALNAAVTTNFQVGLWAANGSLLASTNVTASSPLVGQARYQSLDPLLPPVILTPGQIYRIGVYYARAPIFLDTAGVVAGEAIGTSPEIQLLQLATGSGGFTAPVGVFGTDGSLNAGPNFLYRGGVPEPSCGLLLGLGGVLLAARSRRRRP
jgi:hypothetical protein